MRVVVVRPPVGLLARHPDLFETPDPHAALARALASSPAWDRLSGHAVLTTRPGTDGVVLVGRLPPEVDPLLAALGWQVEDSLRRLLPVSYPDVAAACVTLAGRLRAQLSPDQLRRCRLVGVPRGGLVVAGLLSYALDLPASRVGVGPDDVADPVVVVDDCVLSGARTRRWLREHTGPPVVLAHLHSHPDVRDALADDPQVLAVVAAADLHDHAPQLQGAGYEQWRERWAVRSPDDYWTGQPDHVCYPWNEPDTVVWDDAAGRAEGGWHVVPPAWCLKNRTARPAGDVQAWASAHVPADVVWAFLDDAVVLVSTVRDSSVELRGSGVDFWRRLAATGDLEAAADALAEEYDVERSVLLHDLQAFARDLRDGGWWQPDALPQPG